MPESSDELPVGSFVGDYMIEGVIGQGGMGTVYGARHPVIGKRAAIKVLCAKACADRDQVGRFLQEAQAVNRIGHPNIVDIFAFGVLDDGRSYLVMEWLHGESLYAHLEREKKLEFADAAAILIPLTRALEAAHAAGVIHRDLKPENVMLIPDEEGFRVKLVDFGIAKLSTTQPNARRTATGVTMGTPLFMAPEQARGQDLDARTDLYALGAIAYAMVCGETPFEHESSPVEVLHAHISKPPPAPRRLAPSLPADFEALILELLSKQREDRPDVTTVRQRLKALARSSAAWAAPTDPENDLQRTAARAAEPSRRRFVAAGAGLALTALAIVVIAARGDDASRIAAASPVPSSPVPMAQPAPEPPAPEPPASAPAFGTIDLVVVPARVTVTVDGKRVELAQGRAQLELAPGDHVIATKAPGFFAVDKRVPVVASRVTPIQIKLVRARAKPRPNADAVVNPFKNKKP